MSTFTSLPLEIFSEILIRLTAKDILRCRAVCKEWRATINGSDFINSHLKHSTMNAAKSSQRCHRFRPRPGPSPASAGGARFRVLGSCNGVVALGSLSGDTIFSNPSTRKHIKIPDPPRSKSLSISMGFGYDAVNDDYKLLRTMYCGRNPNPFLVELMVYSLKAKAWKKAGNYLGSENWTRSFCWLCVSSGNSLYWIARPRQGLEEDSKPIMVGFDLASEQCREISLPDHDHEDEDLHVELASFEGFGIGVMASKYRPGSEMLERLEAWVRVEDSWTKKLYVKRPPRMCIRRNREPVSEMASYDGVLLYRNGTESVLFEPKTRMFTVVSGSGYRIFSEEHVCLESLVGIDDSDWKDSATEEKKEYK